MSAKTLIRRRCGWVVPIADRCRLAARRLRRCSIRHGWRGSICRRRWCARWSSGSPPSGARGLRNCSTSAGCRPRPRWRHERQWHGPPKGNVATKGRAVSREALQKGAERGASRGQGSGIEVKEMTTAKTIFYKRQANAQPKTSKLRQPRQEPRSPRGQSRARRSEIGATDQQRAEGRPGRASSPVPAGAAFL